MNTAAIIERHALADGLIFGVMDEDRRRHTVLVPRAFLDRRSGPQAYTGDPHQFDQLAIGAVRLERDLFFHRIDNVLFDKLSPANDEPSHTNY